MSVSKTRKLIRITGAPDECYDWDKSCEQFSIERPIPTTKEYQLTRYRHYYIDHREGKLTSTESELYWLKFAESLCKRFGSKGLSHVKTEVLETLTHVVTL